MTSGLRRIGGDHRDILGECPLWSAAEQALYWVDIRAPAVRRLDAGTGAIDSRPMPDLVGAIAFTDGELLLAALPDRIALLDFESGRLTTLATVPDPIRDFRFNDGRCDAAGRFWVGSMHNVTRAPEGSLYRLEAGGLRPVLSGISIPNSLAWSPDGRVMYFADSLTHRIDAYEYDLASGRLGERSDFARISPPAFPDGSAIDEKGFLWNAEFLGSRVVRYAPDGSVDRVVALPVDRPTCCAFGGVGLTTLFITTTSQNMTAAERAACPMAGALLAFETDVRGVPEPRVSLASLQRAVQQGTP